MLLPGFRHTFRGKTLLDVGCGNGFFINFLQKHGEWTARGIEISEAAAKTAKQEFGLDVFNGNLEDAKLEAQSFDVVYLSYFLEHVFDPPSVLKEVQRILKDDGLVVVSLQNLAGAGFRLFGDRWYGLDLPRHMYDFSPDTFRKLIENMQGLEIREVKFMATPVALFYSLLFEFRHRRLNLLKPLLVLMIPLQFLCCYILAIFHKSDLMTIYLGKTR